MTTSLLVLGGSGFVGPALVEAGLQRGWEVTTFNRGHVPASDPRVQQTVGDRLDPSSLEPLAGRPWDIVVDTWTGAPRAAQQSASLLSGRAGHYVYISSGSVYAPPVPLGVSETAPTVAADPAAEDGDYAERKRGAELAVLEAFGERALLARAGLILGPGEDAGRLTWWLRRMAAGGEVLAPAPPELEIQFVDARDLAAFVLDAAAAARSGPYNVVSRRGHATMGSLLEACRAASGGPDTRLTWLDPHAIEQAGIEAWTELPIWLPPDSPWIAMHAANVEAAHAAGLRCRPAEETVTDTWTWLSGLGGPAPMRADAAPAGLDTARERAALEAWHAAHGATDRRSPARPERDGAG